MLNNEISSSHHGTSPKTKSDKDNPSKDCNISYIDLLKWIEK